jgi:hypothetical protein
MIMQPDLVSWRRLNPVIALADVWELQRLVRRCRREPV